MSKRSLAIAAVLVFSMLPITAGPASAEPGAGTFDCSGAFSAWPLPGGSTGVCTGTATGVYGQGPTLMVCTPLCYFEMVVHNAGSACVAGEPALAANWEGYIGVYGPGYFDAHFQATMVGTYMQFVFDNPNGVGKAKFIPLPPIPTCENPGPMNFHLDGVMSFADPPT